MTDIQENMWDALVKCLVKMLLERSLIIMATSF